MFNKSQLCTQTHAHVYMDTQIYSTKQVLFNSKIKMQVLKETCSHTETL